MPSVARSCGASVSATRAKSDRRGVRARMSPSDRVEVRVASDVHVEHDANWAWVRAQRCASERNESETRATRVMCVAGDVSDDVNEVERCLKEFQKRHDVVAYTFGNHELWMNRADTEEGRRDSREKIRYLLEMCRSIGVVTSPTLIRDEIWVVPLHSYHHKSFDVERDVMESVPPVEVVMNDYRFSDFGDLDMHSEDVARYCDGLNDFGWDEFLARVERRHKVCSFSHFLPRLELIPEKRMLFYPRLAQASGSVFIMRRIDALKARVHEENIAHCFGHTHFGWNARLDGVRYIQAALATPKEWEKRPRSLVIGDFTNASDEPLCVYDGENFVGDDKSAMWSSYYLSNPRTPENVELAPHAREFVQRRWGANRRSAASDEPKAPLPGATGRVL